MTPDRYLRAATPHDDRSSTRWWRQLTLAVLLNLAISSALLARRAEPRTGSSRPTDDVVGGPAARITDVPSKEESSAVKLTTALISQVAILSSLLYYFGWVRTDTVLSYFGLNPTVVGLSAEDY